MISINGQLEFPPGTDEQCDININRYFRPEEYKCREFNNCIKYCNKFFPDLTYCQLTCPNEFDCPYPNSKMIISNDLNNFPTRPTPQNPLYKYVSTRLTY